MRLVSVFIGAMLELLPVDCVVLLSAVLAVFDLGVDVGQRISAATSTTKIQLKCFSRVATAGWTLLLSF